jgi:tubulin-folding cofactor B
LSAVEKFELTPEEYEARRDTVLSHLKANKLGRFADVPTNLTCPPPPPSEIPSGMVVGARCEVQSGEEALARRGTIRFVGQASMGKGGVWVGVQLDEPTGKGDGSVDGKRYFECAAKHAVFVRTDKVTVGDFPEEDLFTDDDDEI